MSTLKVTHLQNESNSAPSISISSAVGGGVTFAGISTFHGAVNIADKIVHTADTNTAIRFPANDTVTVETGGTERLRITSAGLMGLGATNPSDYDGEANDLVVRSGNHTGITIASSGSNQRCNLYFSDGTSGSEKYRGAFTYDHNIDDLYVRTAGAERLRINSAGQVLVGNYATHSAIHGNLEVNGNDGINISNATRTGTNGAQWRLIPHNGGGSATNLRLFEGAGGTEVLNIQKDGKIILNTGNGIQFGSSDSGGSVTSQTLDDYEEGTWTPGLTNFTLGNGILTGQYTKIGNIVHVTFRLDAGSTTTFTGSASGISGLPFTNALASNTGYLTASNPSNNWFGFTQQYSTGTGTNFLQWVTSSSNHQVGSATQPFTWGSSTIMRFNMTYRAA